MIKPEEIHVLVACEESQRVCMAFRERGFDAYSCDIQEPSGGHPEWHILGDVIPVLTVGTVTTMDGQQHKVGKWDLIIAHHPCTYLSCAGAERTFRKDGVIFDKERYDAGVEAAKFFNFILRANCAHIAVENPNIMRNKFDIRKSDQKIEPYMFGEPWYKATNLWLKNVPKLYPTENVEPNGYWVQRNRDAKMRSKTFPGIAKAMAKQWGDYLLEVLE